MRFGLGPVDALLASVGTGGLTVPVIADQYAWLLGATGLSQAIAIIAGAMGVRFSCSRCRLCDGGRDALCQYAFLQVVQAEDEACLQ